MCSETQGHYQARLEVLNGLCEHLLSRSIWSKINRAVTPTFVQWLEGKGQLINPQAFRLLLELILRSGPNFPKARRPLVLFAAGMDHLVGNDEEQEAYRQAWNEWIIDCVLKPDRERQYQLDERIRAIQRSAEADSPEAREELYRLKVELFISNRVHWLAKAHFILLGIPDPQAELDGITINLESRSIRNRHMEDVVRDLLKDLKQMDNEEQAKPDQEPPKPKRKKGRKRKL